MVKKPVGPLPSSEQIRAARAWLRMTQDEFVEQLDVPKRTLARIELAEGMPLDETLRTIGSKLEALGVEFLFDGAVPVGIRVRSRRERKARRSRTRQDDV